MKRIPKRSNPRFKISPINLYLDDLENISDKALSNNFKIIYSDDEFEFESIDEIKEYCGIKLSLLKIQIGNETSNKSIDIIFKKGVLEISSWMPTDELKLIVNDIVDYIRSKHFDYYLFKFPCSYVHFIFDFKGHATISPNRSFEVPKVLYV